MTALQSIIADLIRRHGALTVAQFMELALQHPEHGYYRRHDPLGRGGDFITAPEISQMFGEMIGLWLADCWQKLGRPDPCVLLELGPGRGTLLADALRATRKLPNFHAALRLYLLESNASLRAQQARTLEDFHPAHLDDLSGLPKLPILAVANEFFDALPMRQFISTAAGWCERLVTCDDQNNLVFIVSKPDPACRLLVPEPLHNAAEGFCYELSPASLAVMQQLAARIAAQGGAGLIIDYGYTAPSGQPTLQALAQHAYAPVLNNPGGQDITAHVNFGLLKLAAERAGLGCGGPIGQGDFLHNMGIDLRASQLRLQATSVQTEAITSALHRLCDPAEMGTLFKVLGFVSPSTLDMAGFV
jgi:NADH dehydrogenase [ubiquinone] 1 alpha subcomplex assembly factor 7